MPDWMQVALTALNALGLMVAAAWTWWVKRRDKEAAKTAKPYKELFKELTSKLELVQEGFNLLQEEHVSCREKVARLEERDSQNAARIAFLEKKLGVQA